MKSKNLFHPIGHKDVKAICCVLRGIKYEIECFNPSPSHLFALGCGPQEQTAVTNICSAIKRNPQDRIIIHLMLILIQHVDEKATVLRDLIHYSIKLAPGDDLLFPKIFTQACEKAKSEFFMDYGLGTFFPMEWGDIVKSAPAAWNMLTPVPPSANRENFPPFTHREKGKGKEVDSDSEESLTSISTLTDPFEESSEEETELVHRPVLFSC